MLQCKTNCSKLLHEYSFILFFLIINLLSASPYTSFLYKLLIPVSLLWGIGLLVKRFLATPRFLLERYNWLLILFILFYCITIFVNHKQNLFINAAQLLCTCIFFFVLYNFFQPNQRVYNEIVIKTVIKLFTVITFAISVMSLIALVANVNGHIVLPGVYSLRGGIYFQLNGIATSSSALSYTATLSICASCTLFNFYKKTLLHRLILYINILIQFVVLCLTDSFTGLMVLLVFFACKCFVQLFSNISKRLKSKIWSIILSILLTACGIMIILSMRQVVFYLEKVLVTQTGLVVQGGQIIDKETIENEIPNNENEIPNNAELTKQIAVDRTLKSSLKSGRILIWQSALNEVKREWLLGVGNANISVDIDVSGEIYNYKNLHNGYLTLLLASGVFGCLIVVIFVCIILLYSFYWLITMTSLDILLLDVFSFVVAIMGFNLVNGNFVFGRGYDNVLLWLFLGLLYCETHNKQYME